MRAGSLAMGLMAGASLAALGAACAVSSHVEDMFLEAGEGGAGGAPTTSSGGGASSTTSTTTSTSSGGGPTVPCNGSPCGAGQVCCFRALEPSLSQCGAPGSCAQGYIELSCNEQADCSGTICCGNWNGQTYTGVSCQASCEGFSKIVMCEGTPTACPQGQTCNPSGILGAGYQFCQ